MGAFAAVAIERARVFKTPFPEVQEVADKIGVKLGCELNRASDGAEEDHEIERYLRLNAVVSKNRSWINQIKKVSCQLNHSVPEAVMRAAETRRNYREESPRIAVGVG
jgi:hypothetical protein